MVSRGRVERVMRHQGIRAITPRRFRICTTGSVRRECTDHLIAFNADHLRRILANYAIYYIEMRRSGRTRPAHARSSGSETLLRIRSLAGHEISKRLESSLSQRAARSLDYQPASKTLAAIGCR